MKMKKKDINKIIKAEVREYKMDLLFDSFFPLLSSKVHSIPDVVGPFKLVIDIAALVTIGMIMCNGISAPLLVGAVASTVLSGIMTIGLYGTDYDENVISDIKRKALKNASVGTTDNKEEHLKEKKNSEKKENRENKKAQPSKKNINDSFSNNIESNNNNNHNHKKSKVLVKRK